jgi:hypothetical protein
MYNEQSFLKNRLILEIGKTQIYFGGICTQPNKMSFLFALDQTSESFSC